jgi:hypothetical protein
MKIAVFFNPSAGGSALFQKIGEVLGSKLNHHKVFTGDGLYGGAYLNQSKSFILNNGSFLEKLKTLLHLFVNEKPDLIIGVGGDGLLTYIATFLIKKSSDIPLMGIAGGTENVGPLIRFNYNSLLKLNFEKIMTEKISSVKIVEKGHEDAYAFNDIVIGDTFLGTINGEVENISVKSFLEKGIKVKKVPENAIISNDFSILNNNEKLNRLINPHQIIISPLYKSEFYSGKAVSGSLCLAQYQNKRAAICLSDKILIDSKLTDLNEPVISQHILFSVNDSIRIKGLSKSCYYVLDGNPYRVCSDDAVIKYDVGVVNSVIPENRNFLPILTF